MGLLKRVNSFVRRRILPGPYFAGSDVQIGRNVRFGRNVVFHSRRVRIGDGTIIEDNVTVESQVFEIGDYGTISNGCFFPGSGTLRIGHNFWLGRSAIVDCLGGTTIGNNVGVGAYSQLWTHMVYGDVLWGCRFDSRRELNIEDDAWLVGHCLVSPVRIGARSLVMLGSLVTRDLEPDHTYAGVPARDLTERLGPQFEVRPLPERVAWLRRRLDEFAERQGASREESADIATTPGILPPARPGVTVFNVADRTYRKRGTAWEHRLMWFLLPTAKFIPVE